GGATNWVACDPAGQNLYIADNADGWLQQFTVQGLGVGAQCYDYGDPNTSNPNPNGAGPNMVVISGANFFAANSDGSIMFAPLSQFSTTSGSFVDASLGTGGNPGNVSGIAVDSGGHYLVAACADGTN